MWNYASNGQRINVQEFLEYYYKHKEEMENRYRCKKEHIKEKCEALKKILK